MGSVMEDGRWEGSIDGLVWNGVFAGMDVKRLVSI